MNTKMSGIISRIADLERELGEEFEQEIKEKRLQFQYTIEKDKIAFERTAARIHKKLRQGLFHFLRESSLASLLISPVVYSLFIPLLLLDLWIWLYQAVCFPVYGMAKVERSRYIILDRSRLEYLNLIERFNCNYCGYANGLIAYGREIASRTEQYFCPIKHARRWSGSHSRYPEFLDFGDARGYKKELRKLRNKLKP